MFFSVNPLILWTPSFFQEFLVWFNNEQRVNNTPSKIQLLLTGYDLPPNTSPNLAWKFIVFFKMLEKLSILFNVSVTTQQWINMSVNYTVLTSQLSVKKHISHLTDRQGLFSAISYTPCTPLFMLGSSISEWISDVSNF